MKKKFLAILSAAMMFSVMGAGSAAAAPAKAVPTESHITLKSGSVNVYDYGDVKLHAYFTNDPLADVAYIVEGKEALAGIELPAFTAGLDTWKDYVKSLGKPMNDIFIVCHPGGASYIKGMNVYGTEGAQKSIVSGSTGATTQGLFAAFGADFHGGPEGQDAVAEKISYLNKTKEIMQQSKTADEFKANMKAAFPAYDGENYLDMTAGFLYK